MISCVSAVAAVYVFAEILRTSCYICYLYHSNITPPWSEGEWSNIVAFIQERYLYFPWLLVHVRDQGIITWPAYEREGRVIYKVVYYYGL